MHPDAIRLLEFDTVRHILAGFTSSGPARELALGLEVLEDTGEIDLALTQTAEMLQASEREFRTPAGGVPDVREHVLRAAAGGGPLEGQALWHVATLCEAATGVAAGLARVAQGYPSLGALGARIPPVKDVEKRVKAAVDASGRVMDKASPRLAELRRRILALRRKIEDTLVSLIHNRSIAPHLQYPNPRLHHDRYVLPVSAKRRSGVRGIVHGTSDSGATVYVEPIQIIDDGNELSEAVGAEEEEVEAILWGLTRVVADASEDLLTAQGVLAEVDLLVAKVGMARRYRMSRPTVSRGRLLELREARHPILLWLTEHAGDDESARREPDFGAVVPLDIHLGDEFDVLVVTGPNTGGKTVVLKTLGLVCLMARSGLYVPAEHAIVPLYDAIHVDIGDEQSLEQSLSTFSSHMGRIIRVLNSATDEGLVLLDELGAGTDPTEGAALALAVLQEMVRRRCSAVVTTHLGRLKTFAGGCPQAENACVEFDAATLRPTYELTIGSAGSSNALEIAGRLGMPDALLQEARATLDDASGGEYGSMLDQVALAGRDAEQRRKRAQWLESEAEKLKAEYEEALSRLKDEEERTGADVGMKIRDDLERLSRSAAGLYDEVRFSHKAYARKVREVRDGLRAVLERTEKLVEGHAPPRPIQAGDEVYVVRVHKWGKVERVDPQHARALVSVGGMQMQVGLDGLVPWGSDMGSAGKR